MLSQALGDQVLGLLPRAQAHRLSASLSSSALTSGGAECSVPAGHCSAGMLIQITCNV